MAIYSPLRSRRLAAQQQAETLQRLITFKLGGETFGVPLERVYKVTTLDRLYGDPDRTGISLSVYQGRELAVIDVGQRIFGKMPQILPSSPKNISNIEAINNPDLVRYLVILKSDREELVGIPIDSTPSIQSIPMSAFQPLPEIYQQHSNFRCVSSVSIDSPDRPAVFLLDIGTIFNG